MVPGYGGAFYGAVLRNGLDKDENEILFNSINIPEITSLILKGINKAFNY